jgi:hypothetical protein
MTKEENASSFIKAMFDVPSEVFQYVGYGLFVGKK